MCIRDSSSGVTRDLTVTALEINTWYTASYYSSIKNRTNLLQNLNCGSFSFLSRSSLNEGPYRMNHTAFLTDDFSHIFRRNSKFENNCPLAFHLIDLHLFRVINDRSKMCIRDSVDLDPKEWARVEAIIYSMTPAERRRPDVIDGSRKRRIARGSGTSVQEVNRLLKQFFQARKMLFQMSSPEKMGRFRLF